MQTPDPSPSAALSRWLLSVGALLLLLVPLRAQAPVWEPDMPEDLKSFWSQYQPAAREGEEERMDRAVRLGSDKADMALDILLDDYCAQPRDELPHWIRQLAWSLDRTQRTTRFITRARFVLDLEPEARLARRAAVKQLEEAWKIAVEAAQSTEPGPQRDAASAFERAAAAYEAIEEWEFSVRCWANAANSHMRAGDTALQAVALRKVIEQAVRLSFTEPLLAGAEVDLRRLDEGGGGAAPGAGGASAGDGGPGRSIDSLRAGSAPVVVALEPDVPRRGLAPVNLPSPFPLDNFFLWPHTWVEGNGPSDFDRLATVPFLPWGRTLKLSRAGSEFRIDVDGDGKPETVFTPNSSPQRIEIPAPDGGPPLALMVATGAERESMFSMELNYSPQPAGARLRFHIASTMDGVVLGETWKIFDSNLTGSYGDLAEHWGDGYTRREPEETRWFEPDAVQIGKARGTLPLSSVMPVGETFQRVTIRPDGRQLTVQELDLELGQVRLDCATKVAPVQVLIREVDGRYPGAILDVVPARKGGSVAVPAGRWQFCFATIASGAKTSMKLARAYIGRSQPFTVEPGQTVVLSLGAPFVLDVLPPATAPPREEGEADQLLLDFRTLRIFGRGGEEWALLFDDPLLPEVELLGPDGKRVGKPLKTRRSELDEWQRVGDAALWFAAPLDVAGILKTGAPVPKLSVKSHVLLGGPFATHGTK